MKKYSFFLLLVFCLAMQARAQSGVSSGYRLKGKSQQVSFTASVPVGVFAGSHLPGGGFAYAWSSHRFGDSVNNRKLIGFTAQAGFDYYLGKKVTTAGYAFRYSNYSYIQLMPGIVYNPTPGSNVILLAGPALGIGGGSSSLGLGVSLSGGYHFNPRFSVGPVALYRKHAEVDALWAVGLKLGYVL